MRFINICVVFILVLVSCSGKVVEQAGQMEKKLEFDTTGLITKNYYILEELKRFNPGVTEETWKSLIYYALIAVKKDTTELKNKHFHFKGWIVDYNHEHDLFDSLLKAELKIETEIIEEKDYYNLLGVENKDTLLMKWTDNGRVYGEGHGRLFRSIIEVIKIKNGYPDVYQNVLWRVREVSFEKFRKSVLTKDYRKRVKRRDWKDSYEHQCEDRGLNDITSIDPEGNDCDPRLEQYCKYKTWKDNSLLRINNWYLYKAMSNKIYGMIDTLKLLPMKLTFDSLGNISSVKTKNRKYEKELCQVFECLNGIQEVKFLNKKKIGFSFYIPEWLSVNKKDRILPLSQIK